MKQAVYDVVDAVRRQFVPDRVAVEVNLNAVTADGLIRVRASDMSRQPEVGQRIRIYNLDDEIEGLATVSRINPRTGLAYLDVAWDSLTDLVVHAWVEEVGRQLYGDTRKQRESDA